MTFAPARGFGTPGDLAVDFASPDRPAIITRILSRCLPEGDDEHWWQCTVSERIAALLRVVSASESKSSLSLQSRCEHAACNELLTFDLPMDALLALAPPDMPLTISTAGAGSAQLRRPRGSDLRHWRQAAQSRHELTTRNMIEALLIEGEVGEEDEPAVVSVLAAADPLVAFAVECVCPGCGTQLEVPVDLEAIALSRLRRQQDALLREIHLLASHYGWSESEIAALPAARRARYVSLIEH